MEIITTEYGKLEGIELEHTFAYLGIPYAKAERFKAPQPFYWDGILSCREYGNRPVETTFNRKIPVGEKIQHLGSEDCLNLNIWTPKSGKKNLPVVFYVYGGAYQTGCNSMPAASGEAFLKDEEEMIFVSANYRLGVLGFMEWGNVLGEEYCGSGNNGLRDTIAALKWVHDNIEAFGGDPGRVTLMGLSAGAKTCAVLTLCPSARNYFSQIICESGAYQSLRPIESAQRITERYLDILGTRDPETILYMNAYELLDAQIRMSDTQGSTCFYGPIFDAELFPKNWKADYEHGMGWKGNALLGSCRNETFGNFQGNDLADVDRTVSDLFGLYAKYAYEAYERLADGGVNEDESRKLWIRITSDFMYRTYTDRYASWLSNHGSEVYNYSVEFNRASHGFGFMLMLGNYDAPMLKSALKEEDMKAAKELHRRMKACYVRFILTGCPDENWSQWRDEEKTKRLFDAEDSLKKDCDQDTIGLFPEYMYL